MSNLLNTDYQKIFPENLKKYKNLRTLATEFEKNIKEVISEVPKLAIYKNLEQQSDEILSELAYQYTIDNWKESLAREIKIELIKNAYWAHAKKGTKVAVTENLKKLNYPLEVQEWFEYRGKPFTFKITTNTLNTNTNWIDELVYILEKYKNCRSILDTVEIETDREKVKYRTGGFKCIELEKEFIGTHPDIYKVLENKNGIFRIIEMEVGNV